MTCEPGHRRIKGNFMSTVHCFSRRGRVYWRVFQAKCKNLNAIQMCGEYPGECFYMLSGEQATGVFGSLSEEATEAENACYRDYTATARQIVQLNPSAMFKLYYDDWDQARSHWQGFIVRFDESSRDPGTMVLQEMWAPEWKSV